MAKDKTKKKGVSLGVKLLLILLALIIAGGLGAFIFVSGLGSAVCNPEDQEGRVIVIESGSYTGSIAEQLETEGIITSASNFKLFSKFNHYDGQYQAGTYTFSPSMTMDEIAQILVEGRTNQISFTIPEGLTEYETAAKLEKQGVRTKKNYVKLMEKKDFSEKYPFLKDAQDNKHRLEGYLFPNTYTLPEGSTEEDVIDLMLSTFDEVFTDEFKERAKKLKMDMNEVMVVASIIENEAAVDEDREIIASVIYNRLEIDMPLQMDSTIQYILSLDSKRKKDLLYVDTEIESEYNTYLHAGLPPGPICSPGEASIRAALYPADTDYIYFILSDKLDGTMKFSKDYDEFLKDKDAYYKARDDE